MEAKADSTSSQTLEVESKPLGAHTQQIITNKRMKPVKAFATGLSDFSKSPNKQRKQLMNPGSAQHAASRTIVASS